MTTERPTRHRRSWGELSPRARAATVAATTVQLGLLAAALTDLRRRDRSQVNGPRWLWALTSFVSIIGPLAYFTFGRKR